MRLPALTITSYIRSSGSHAKGDAFDIMIKDWGDLDLSYTKKIQLYKSIYVALAQSMQVGAIWIADPAGSCLHYHVDLSHSPRYGFETPKWIDGDCKYGGVTKYSSLDQLIRQHFGNNWQPSSIVLPAIIFDRVKRFKAGSDKHKEELHALFARAWPLRTKTLASLFPSEWLWIVAVIVALLSAVGYFVAWGR